MANNAQKAPFQPFCYQMWRNTHVKQEGLRRRKTGLKWHNAKRRRIKPERVKKMNGKKYELTTETRVVLGRTLYRIRALVAFGSAEAGELGGWIEKESNLAQGGNAWVYGNAEVYGDARVYGDAEVVKPVHFLTIGAIGSRNSITTFFRTKDKQIKVSCGCFLGTIAEFAEKVKQTHGDSKHAKTYALAIELAKAQIEDVEV